MNMNIKYNFPDAHGKFGEYGGRFVPETLMTALSELEECYLGSANDPGFKRDYDLLQKEYNGRPTPLEVSMPEGQTLYCI